MAGSNHNPRLRVVRGPSSKPVQSGYTVGLLCRPTLLASLYAADTSQRGPISLLPLRVARELALPGEALQAFGLRRVDRGSDGLLHRLSVPLQPLPRREWM